MVSCLHTIHSLLIQPQSFHHLWSHLLDSGSLTIQKQKHRDSIFKIVHSQHRARPWKQMRVYQELTIRYRKQEVKTFSFRLLDERISDSQTICLEHSMFTAYLIIIESSLMPGNPFANLQIKSSDKVEDGRETTLKCRFLAVRTYRVVSSFY